MEYYASVMRNKIMSFAYELMDMLRKMSQMGINIHRIITFICGIFKNDDMVLISRGSRYEGQEDEYVVGICHK